MPDVVLVVLPGAYASSVAATLDVLAAAAALAPGLSLAPPRVRVVAPQADDVALTSGLRIAADPLPDRLPAGRPLWIVPGLGTATASATQRLLESEPACRVGALLARASRRGDEIAASCAAVLLLGKHRLLDGRRATCTWWLADLLRAVAPSCAIETLRMVVEDGPLVTAGAAMAHVDLMLALLRRRYGRPLAERVGQVLLIESRPLQGRFVQADLLALGDELVAELEAIVRDALPRPPSVGAVAQRLAMSTRTLSRRVKAATGRSPSQLVQAVRLTAARTLLQTSRLTVDEVAERVGYQDAASLRRLMRRTMSATPTQLRI